LSNTSQAEVKIADELDRQGLFFFPNCMGRLSGADGKRVNRSPDFLICTRPNRWGILEVDGEPFHPPSRTVHDRERDRLFRAYGIKVVEHYDAALCYEQPAEVVRNFLLVMTRIHGG
jgi:hypothetical protein